VIGSLVVYCESIKRKDKKERPIHECRYDERLKTKAEESTRLTYTGLLMSTDGRRKVLIEFIMRGKARAKENTYKWVSV
jgi:hypothetical protein